MEGLKPLSEEALEIYNTFELKLKTKTMLQIIIKKFDDHFEPQKNVTFEWCIFNSRVQAPGQSIDQFVTDLKTKDKLCKYG